MRFSIIVPIFNGEKYLEECIKSIISQNFRDYEVLLINDGSDDNSKTICEKYEKKDPKFLCINKKNSGAADSRNKGILHAKGEYILFLDSDDMFFPNVLSRINSDIESDGSQDMYVGQFSYYIKDVSINKTKYCFNKSKLMTEKKTDVLAYLFTEIPEQTWSVWRNIYRREFLLKEKLFFRKDLIIGEDLDLVIKSILKSKNISCINYPIINYRISREDSVTSKLDIRRVKNIVFLCKYWIKYFENDMQCSEFSRKLIYNRLVFSFAAIFINYNKISDEDKCQIDILINSNIDIFKYSNKLYVKIIFLSYKLLGFGKTSKLLKKFMKVKSILRI